MRQLSPTARTATAYHEAGHLVVAWRLGLPVHRASIIRDAHAHGFVQHKNPLFGIRLEMDGTDRARLRAEKAIMVSLAGPIAQRRYNSRSWRSAHGNQDYDTATELVLYANGSPEAASAHLRWLEIRTADLLNACWHVVEGLSAELLVRGSMNSGEIRKAISAASLVMDC